MSTQPNVVILLATFNGARHLSAQIESIRNQDYLAWRLILRDDNSSDDTVRIIDKYVELDERISKVENASVNTGVAGNFFSLLEGVDADFVMFSDQDDEWFPNKISECLSFYMKECKDNAQPFLLFCNSIMTNGNLEPISQFTYGASISPCSLNNFLFLNGGYQGSAMFFNRALLNHIFPIYEHCPVHDYHVSLVAILYGTVRFLNVPLFYYRRHSTTVTVLNRSLRSKARSIFRKRYVFIDTKHLFYLKRFVSARKSEIRDHYIQTIKEYFSIADGDLTYIEAARKILKNNFTLRGSRFYLLMKYLIS